MGLVCFCQSRETAPTLKRKALMDPGNDPAVSIIIPTYAAQPALSVTLDSLLAQSLERWEGLLVEDASSDQTTAIINAYSARDPRFRRSAGTGQGPAAARNTGLAAARGRWLVFLDAGAWIDSHYLDKMTRALIANSGARAAWCECLRVAADGDVTPVHRFACDAKLGCGMHARPFAVPMHTVLMERELLARAGGFDPALTTCEDWDLWQRVARLGGRWLHVDEPLCFFSLGARSSLLDPAQLLADGKVVTARASTVDERVPAGIPPYQQRSTGDGDDGAIADRALACLACWCGGLDCGQGGDGAAALEVLASVPLSATACASLLADVLIDGILTGLPVAANQLAARWQDYGPGMTALIGKLGATWNDPVAARAIQYRLERLILAGSNVSEPRQLGLTLGFPLDIRDPAPLAPPAGIDRLYVCLRDRTSILAYIDLGVVGTITTRQWIELMIETLGIRKTVQAAAGSLGPPLLWQLPGSAVREVLQKPRSALRHPGPHLASACRQGVLAAAGAARPPGSHAACLHQLRLESDLEADSTGKVGLGQKPTPSGVDPFHRAGRREFWENWFEQSDPWNYDHSAYEREKYARQIALLPGRPIGVALELACAEGRFTQELAQHVDRLVATDISTKALERARARCRANTNIEFRPLDFSADPLPAAMDLIFCSEVLYYLNDEEELRTVARRLAAALKPGGHIVTAHAHVLKDDLSHTGFDWETPYGAKTIARVFAETPGLALERSLQAGVYRIDRFTRIDGDAQPIPPVVEHVPITAEIEPDVARHIVWGGAVARRAEVASTERRPHVPVLRYHRVAISDRPESGAGCISLEMFRAQMTWLRRNGYHFIGSLQLARSLRDSRPFVGRPVMISFDAGFQDFADKAWPILRIHDFSAEVFVEPDLVGKVGDAGAAGETSMMNARTIARLAAEGVRFGSHLGHPCAAEGLSTRALAAELLHSRAMLGKWLGKPPHSFAIRSNVVEQRVGILAAECGFTAGFATRPGVASHKADPMNLPRIEVRGEWTLDDFIRCMEHYL